MDDRSPFRVPSDSANDEALIKLASHQGFSVGVTDLCYKNSFTSVATADLEAILRAARASSGTVAELKRPGGDEDTADTFKDVQGIRTPKRRWSRLTRQQREDIAARYGLDRVTVG